MGGRGGPLRVSASQRRGITGYLTLGEGLATACIVILVLYQSITTALGLVGRGGVDQCILQHELSI